MSLDTQTKHQEYCGEALSESFETRQDKDAALSFTAGAYLQEMGYNQKQFVKQGIFRPKSLKKRKIMSALGASPSLNETVLKQAISVERSMKVASCDFALQSIESTTDPYQNIEASKTVSQYVDTDMLMIRKESVRQSSETVYGRSSVHSKQSRIKGNSQAANNVNKARLKRVLQVDGMCSEHSQNLFKSEREKENYLNRKTPILSPTSQTRSMQGQLTLNLEHLLTNDSSQVVDSSRNCDLQKIKFIEELHKMMQKTEDYYNKQQYFQLTNCALITAFLAVQFKEFVLAMKIYSISAEMLVKHSQYKLALLLYTKLVNTAYTLQGQYSEFKLYAYKQVSFCYMMMRDYDLALKALKKGLQLAWVVNSYTAENVIYDKMAICYYYKGNLKKAAYYNNRFLRGVSEAGFSRVRKICVIQSKDLAHFLEKPPKDFHGIKSLFSQVVKNYSLTKPSIQVLLQEINQFTTNSHQFSTQIMDPGNQFLNQQSPIQSPKEQHKKRGLPSPSTVNSDKNALLLSNLQVLKRKEFTQRKQFLEKARKDARMKLIKEIGAEKASLVSDKDLLKNEPEINEIDKLTVIVDDENQSSKTGPVVAMVIQKKMNKLRESDIKNQFQMNDLRSNKDKAEIKRKQMSIDLKDVRERAQKFSTKVPQDRISLRHTTTKRRTHAKFEGQTQFQIENDLYSFKEEFSREAKNVFLCNEGANMLSNEGEKKVNAHEFRYYNTQQKVVAEEAQDCEESQDEQVKQ